MKKNSTISPETEVKPTKKKKASEKDVSNWENDGGNNIAPLLSAEQALKQAKAHQLLPTKNSAMRNH